MQGSRMCAGRRRFSPPAWTRRMTPVHVRTVWPAERFTVHGFDTLAHARAIPCARVGHRWLPSPAPTSYCPARHSCPGVHVNTREPAASLLPLEARGACQAYDQHRLSKDEGSWGVECMWYPGGISRGARCTVHRAGEEEG